MSWSNVPYELLDTIFFFLQDPEGTSLEKACSSKESAEVKRTRRTIQNCALVCRTWLPVARRRLLKYQFPEGKVQVSQEAREMTTLVDVILSPLSTFDSDFVRELRVVSKYKFIYFYKLMAAKPSKLRSFYAALADIDGTRFPSLDTLAFDTLPIVYDDDSYEGSLDEDKREDEEGPEKEVAGDGTELQNRVSGQNDTCANGSDMGVSDLAVTSILARIKHLKFTFNNTVPLVIIAQTMTLCTSVQKVTIEGGFVVGSDDVKHLDLVPPQTLYHLDLNTFAFTSPAKWLLSCQHVQVSSLRLDGFVWPYSFERVLLRVFCEEVGSHLEYLELNMTTEMIQTNHHEREPLSIPNRRAYIIPFLKNSSLKRIVIYLPLDMSFVLLPFLFEQSNFAPSLETLEVIVWDVVQKHISEVEKLLELDGYLQSRPKFRRFTFKCPREEIFEEDWKILEAGVRKFLPVCQEGGKLETVLSDTAVRISPRAVSYKKIQQRGHH